MLDSTLESLNFFLTNRVPRALFTRVMGRLSRIENPLFTRMGIAVWQFFDPLNFDEAETMEYRSLQECFTRRLKHGVRPIDFDPAHLVSPCDAVVGAFGAVQNGLLYQIKGAPYGLDELMPAKRQRERFWQGKYITLRLKSSMYHRFHAPCDGRVTGVTYISGDTWNVNPPTLRRIDKLFCKNERAVIEMEVGPDREQIALVPVAAILVASMQLNVLQDTLGLNYQGPEYVDCDTCYRKGDELGYFKQGSTIILFVPEQYEFVAGLQTDEQIKMGQPIMTRPTH